MTKTKKEAKQFVRLFVEQAQEGIQANVTLLCIEILPLPAELHVLAKG